MTSLNYIASKYLYLTTANRVESSPINGAQLIFPQDAYNLYSYLLVRYVANPAQTTTTVY